MDESALSRAHSNHPHRFADLVHAYPVLSRRAGGISIGVNLNVDKACNFDCPYCQVDRRVARERVASDPLRVAQEVEQLLDDWEADRLAHLYPGVAAEHLRLNDVALSGDGESTMDPSFPEVCRALEALRSRRVAEGKAAFKLVLISNATLLGTERVQSGLVHLCATDGEVWGKLDAGTEAFYREVNASRVPLERIQENLEWAASHVPLRIQTLFYRYGALVPDPAELEAWLDRLGRIAAAGRILSVQIHTVARQTAKAGCRPMPLEWLEAVAQSVRTRHGLVAEAFAGSDSGAIGEEA